mgnify:CR=1 FL=1
MPVTQSDVTEALRRVKGPDLEGNIVDLGLVSEILIKDTRVYFSITVPASRAAELEPLRKAAETVVGEIAGVSGVTAVLTAETARATGAPAQARPGESSRVAAARTKGGAGEGAHAGGHSHGHSHPPAAAPQGARPVAGRRRTLFRRLSRPGSSRRHPAPRITGSESGVSRGLKQPDAYPLSCMQIARVRGMSGDSDTMTPGR